MKNERPMADSSLVFAPNAATRPWLTCAGLGLLALALILGGVGLLEEDINGLVKAMPIVVGVGAAVVAADVWRTRPAATGADLTQTQKDIAHLSQELGALKDTFQQIRGTVPLLPGRIEQLEGTVRRLDDRISGLALPSQGPSTETAVGMVRALLVQTDTALSNKFTEVSKKMDSVGMDIARIVGVVQGAVLGEMNRLLQQIESRTEGREELTRRLDKLSAVMDELKTLPVQTDKYDPELVRGIADRVANLQGIGSDTRAVLNTIQQGLGAVSLQQQTIMEEIKRMTRPQQVDGPPPPPSVSLGEQSERLLKCYQVEEKEVGTFAMAPFWLACASVLPGAISQAGGFDPALRARSHDVVESSRDILDRAAVQMEKGGYKNNISRMRASFDAGSTARDQAERLVEGVVQKLSHVLLGRQEAVTGEVRKVSSSLTVLRGRLGTLVYLLPGVSFDILGPSPGAGKELAWVLLGQAMAEYIEKHYGGRLVG